MNTPLPIAPEIDAIVERLRTAPRVTPPRPAGEIVVARAWMPAIEEEGDALHLQLKGLAAIAAARHALAVVHERWDRDKPGRVIVRDLNWEAHAFDVQFVSGPRQIATAIRCCRVCGCTEDRACVGGCAWARVNLCTACAESPHG